LLISLLDKQQIKNNTHTERFDNSLFYRVVVNLYKYCSIVESYLVYKIMKDKIKIKYSLNSMINDSIELANRLKLIKFNFKNIYCSSSNSHVLGIILSYELGLPIIYSRTRISDETLMVTHLIGKGNPFSKKNTIASLFIEKDSKITTAYYSRILKDNQWIDFC